jgi:formamidopyrimidine-DNA glycosylase
VDQRVADPGLVTELAGYVVTGVRRKGKVVLIDADAPAPAPSGGPLGGPLGGPRSIGLHFGMTGRVIVDGVAAIDRLEYSSGRDRREWDRLQMFTEYAPTGAISDVPAVRMNDPRRLGRISLDPDLDSLGTDIFKTTAATLALAFDGRTVAVKTALLNQQIVAGLGNLCADEVLWWASIAPRRTVDTLSEREVKALASAVRRRLPIMLRRGGSNMGVLTPELRAAAAACPRDACMSDGANLQRSAIGGRTAVWCPSHQR